MLQFNVYNIPHTWLYK